MRSPALDPTRATARWEGGILSRAQREAVQAEVMRLHHLARPEPLRLRCFCVRPDGSGTCHGTVIRRVLLELEAGGEGA
ncbi:MAG: hypothetical protein GEU90_13425 [Gemmatimonas sp.]|nr:hypothetical protein [Gemmatimonas sp.]